MSGDLCDAVIESTGSSGVLECLERTNHFVVPLDRREEWYRYHHLFAELLRNELARSEPEAVADLNRRAMGWCVAHGFTEAALIYGHEAGEADTVAGLVDELSLPTHYDGRMETLEGWLRMFSEDELRRYPALAVVEMEIRGLGRATFAAVLLMIAGSLNVIYGIAAISEANFFTDSGTHFVFLSLNTWGWIILLLGTLELTGGVSLLSGNTYAASSVSLPSPSARLDRCSPSRAPTPSGRSASSRSAGSSSTV
jgi:hypothetical protein